MKKRSFPRFAESVRTLSLPNGMSVFVVPKREAPIACIQACVRTGSIHEEEFLGCGLSHFLEHMLFMGSGKYPGNTASDCITHLGGYFNAATSKDYTTYITFLPSESAETAMDILADMLRNPLFPEDKFASEKNVILRECAMYQDSPEDVLDEALEAELFRFHPARIPIIGYKEKIETVTRSMMKAYYDRRYAPNRSFLVVAGDVEPERIFDCFSDKFGTWTMGSLREPVLPCDPPRIVPGHRTLAFADPQTRMAAAWRVPGISDPRYAAVKAFVNLLGECNNSCLDQVLVMDKELAYDVSGSVYPNDGISYASFYASCQYENLERLSAEFYRTLDTFIRKGPGRDELEGTVLRLRSSLQMSLLSAESLCGLLMGTVLQSGDPASVDAYIDSFGKLTPEDVMETGKAYFRRECVSQVDMVPEEKKHSGKVPAKTSGARKKPEMTVSPEGRRTILLEDPSVPFAGIQLKLPCGPYCGGKLCAAGYLLADVLPTGTKKYSEEEIAKLTTDNSISLDIRGEGASLVFKMTAPLERFELGREILRSILQEPLLERGKVERERLALLDEWKTNMVNPESLAFDGAVRFLSGGFPAFADMESILASLEKISAADLKKVYREICFAPEMTILGFAGSIDRKTADETERMLFGPIALPKAPLPVFPEAGVLKKPLRKKIVLDKKQAVMVVGFPGVSTSDPEGNALEILKEAESSMSSKLFDAVRNQNGLAYYTGVRTVFLPVTGAVLYYAGTEKDSLPELEKIFDAEIARVCREGLSGTEIADAKKWITFRDSVQMQSPFKLLASMMRSEFAGNGYLFPFEHSKIINALTKKEIDLICRKYLSSPAKLTLTVEPHK